MKIRRLALHGLLLAAMVSSGSAAGAAPVDHDEENQKAASGMPDTAAGYLKRAAEYEQRAKDLREEARAHRVMLDDFIRKEPPNKTGGEYPWVAKMRKHCEGYIRQSEALAREAEGFAEFLRWRAKELGTP
jgi:hypothetical protein